MERLSCLRHWGLDCFHDAFPVEDVIDGSWGLSGLRKPLAPNCDLHVEQSRDALGAEVP